MKIDLENTDYLEVLVRFLSDESFMILLQALHISRKNV